MAVGLRSVQSDDRSFLYELYCSTRADELGALGWSELQREVFLKQQFAAQQRAFDGLSHADHQIILKDGRPIGRMIVVRNDEELRLADIALLAEHRNHGIGTSLIRELLNEAQSVGKPMRLQVLNTNRAILLYQRMGLEIRSERGMYLQMQWDSRRG
ncbi:MAG: GNAT family N-acetyltransferase [Phycisphaerales bacterium]|nr:GNAT family N-acetyltransferase [Phycisphaerales bacterium]